MDRHADPRELVPLPRYGYRVPRGIREGASVLLLGAAVWTAGCVMEVAGFALLLAVRNSPAGLRWLSATDAAGSGLFIAASSLFSAGTLWISRAAELRPGRRLAEESAEAERARMSRHSNLAGLSFALVAILSLAGFVFVLQAGGIAVAGTEGASFGVVAGSLTLVAVASFFLLHASIHVTLLMVSLRRRYLPDVWGRTPTLRGYATLTAAGSLTLLSAVVLLVARPSSAWEGICIITAGALLSTILAPIVGLFAFPAIARLMYALFTAARLPED